MLDWLTSLTTQHPIIGQALAGAAGGVVRSLTPPHGSVLESIANVVIGSLCAIYLGPVAIAVVERIVGIEISDQGGNLGAFLVGLFGMTLTGILIDAAKIARRKQKEDNGGA